MFKWWAFLRSNPDEILNIPPPIMLFVYILSCRGEYNLIDQ